ncbi:hypothetical protein Xmau_00621 [Xenorhabdus mauleonii]|uniref:Uncharacterized protein n=1 Tax=Xenorhabdus mauleonii TaxID=351675 RepID=A0A1I3JHT9_9GAMM|nr:hypothetical protein [Xenorhabdus mauleonii]PHM46215.1 hypothetical protein Xmau_00621 [Xenorhabdus mauleonii]SFI59843.1 hypothetical protein SAMN05421680_102216 [Xenorhabdus mauleonii]
MDKIRWELSRFNVFFTGKYNTIYDVEEDINTLYGSSNFSGLDSVDWFLLNKKNNNLSFVLLSVPSSFCNDEQDFEQFEIERLIHLELDDCIHNFVKKVIMQEKAFFSLKRNQLIVSSNISSAFYKVKISDDLYFLLNSERDYVGFLLENSTENIVGYSSPVNNTLFNELLLRMMNLCNDKAYDAMDDQDEKYLIMLNELEKDCLSEQHRDARISEIRIFIKNSKSTFYDIDEDND